MTKHLIIFIFLCFLNINFLVKSEDYNAFVETFGNPETTLMQLHSFQTNNNLDQIWSDIESNKKGMDTRSICEFLVEIIAYNWPQNRIYTTLGLVSSLQITNKSNPYYGNFLWRTGDSQPTISSGLDTNCVLFSGTYLTLLRLSFYHKLNISNQNLLDDIISRMIVSLERDIDDRRTSYTNTWAMRMWVLCGLGEALNDISILENGKAALREWMQEIRQYGIIEYNSGGYGQVAGRPLGCLVNLVKDQEIHREASIGLRYFSRLYAGNFVSYDDRGMVYGGPQSRNYNFIHSKGGRDLFYRMFTGYPLDFFNTYAAWNLSADDLTLYNTRPRTVIYKNGTTPQHYVVHYVGSKFSMGCAGMPYGAEDKTYVINLFDSARPAVVHISSIFDGRSDPYGENQVNVKNGTKPRHLSNYLMASAQRTLTNGSEMVFLIAGDGTERGDTQYLNHYTILPADRQDGIWNGNTKVTNLPQGMSQNLSNQDNSTLFIRFGDVAVGIRYLKVLNVHGQDVTSQVKLVNIPNQEQTISAGTAMYLQAQLSTTKPNKYADGVVAAWWKVKEGVVTESDFQTFRDEMINAHYTFNHINNANQYLKN